MPTSELARPVEHGGDLAAASAAYGEPKNGWLDLSTGINPYPYPIDDLPPHVWVQLPSPSALSQLCDAARGAYGVSQKTALTAVPGASAAISVLPRLVEARRKVAIISPTYGEYARSWALAGHDVREVPNLPRASGLDVVVVCNPDNPTGRLFDNNELLALADDLGVGGGMLIVDESFADPQPRLSLAYDAPHPALVVVRSFGKFYGLPGIRLGFCFGARRFINRIETAIGPWAISGPAIVIGTAALNDAAWAQSMRHHLVDQAHGLDSLLTHFGLTVQGGTPLFRLAAAPGARRIHQRLAGEGIWTRAFSYAPQWLRFGLPGGDKKFARLEHAMARIDAGGSSIQ